MGFFRDILEPVDNITKGLGGAISGLGKGVGQGIGNIGHGVGKGIGAVGSGFGNLYQGFGKMLSSPLTLILLLVGGVLVFQLVLKK